MPVYQDSDQLYSRLKSLFERIQSQDASAESTLAGSRLIIRLRLTSPSAEVVINGRKNPVQITYGSTALRPDLDVELSADGLHGILMGELSLRKALASGQMKVRGPLHKSFVLENILHLGQAIYPQIVVDA